jgi:hypothetical protein
VVIWIEPKDCMGIFEEVFDVFGKEVDFAGNFTDAIITMTGNYIKRFTFDIGLSYLNYIMAKWTIINDEEVNGLEGVVYERLMESSLGKCLPVFIPINTTWIAHE